ncbi:MAG TPA: hypothetical protein VN132_09365 [Bdellovibrio sp.]|nr:hypothetical protein [Bdellovibrio sp.]
MNTCLRIIILSATSISLFACAKVHNSSSLDKVIYGTQISGTPNFVAARSVLAANCFMCHAEWANYAESDYLSNFLITSRDPNSSTIYTAIRGNDSGTAGSMPQGNPDLSYDDIQLIKTWISGI